MKRILAMLFGVVLCTAVATPAFAQMPQLDFKAGFGPAMLHVEGGGGKFGWVMPVKLADEPLVDSLRGSNNLFYQTAGFFADHGRLTTVMYDRDPVRLGIGLGLEKDIYPKVGVGIWWTSFEEMKHKPLKRAYLYWQVYQTGF